MDPPLARLFGFYNFLTNGLLLSDFHLHLQTRERLMFVFLISYIHTPALDQAAAFVTSDGRAVGCAMDASHADAAPFPPRY
jgi:hypothetical protein